MKFSNLTIKIYFLFLFLGVQLSLTAQDPFLTQSWNIPSFYNPALTGLGQCEKGTISILHKDQWRTISNTPYSTQVVDYSFNLKEKSNSENSLGIGLLMMNDMAGETRYQSLQALLSLAGHVEVSEHSYLSLGFQGGIAQRKLNPNLATFNQQFTGTGFNSNLPSGEIMDRGQLGHWDFNAGIAYTNTTNKSSISVGGAYFHLTSPNISLWENGEEFLPHKFIGHFTLKQELSKNTMLIFNLMSISQGNIQGQDEFDQQKMQTDLQLGGGIKFTDSNTDLFLGLYTLNTKTVAPVAKFQIPNSSLSFMVSFEIDFSKIQAASRNFGGFELGASWQFGDCKDIKIICPTF